MKIRNIVYASKNTWVSDIHHKFSGQMKIYGHFIYAMFLQFDVCI